MTSFTRYLKEVGIEMAKVIWPSWSELVGATIVTLIIVAFLAMFLFGVDALLQLGAQKLYTIYGGLR